MRLLLLSLCATSLHAQSAEEALKAQLIRDWQQVKAYTQEHQGHHRGQTTIYLRMAGIRPPAERLF